MAVMTDTNKVDVISL